MDSLPLHGRSHRRQMSRRLAVLTMLTMVGTASPALAQNVSNEAWLGQVGGNNLLDILQEGRGNSAGSDNRWLLLGQDGSDNLLMLDQFGYNNKLGTLFADVPAYARGVWQRGDLNAISISQSATGTDGSNMIGSIQQYSRLGLALNSSASNSLRIVQSGVVAQHYVGRIVQLNGSGTGELNRVFALQTEDGLDSGNILANVRQVGSGNSFGTIQRGQSNRIGDIPTDNTLPIGGVVQRGVDNSAWIVQVGQGNLVEYVSQYGRDNANRVFLSGKDNAVFQILQNNESWAEGAVGNRIEVSISGDGNGGNGGAWVGEYLALDTLGTPGIGQAVLQQLGEDNDLRLTIIQGLDTRYGVSQFGDGNGAHVSIYALAGQSDAEDNETAIFQNGDLNYARHENAGNGNLGTMVQVGERNRASILQSGVDNVVAVRIEGNRNNVDGGALGGASAPVVAALMPGLLPGDLQQFGQDHDATIDIVGHNNGYLALQLGEGHQIDAAIVGNFNSLAILQQGLGQTSISAQIGLSNSLGVYQF